MISHYFADAQSLVIFTCFQPQSNNVKFHMLERCEQNSLYLNLILFDSPNRRNGFDKLQVADYQKSENFRWSCVAYH